MDALMPRKIAEGRTNFPHTVVRPDRQKSIEVSLIKAMAVVAHQCFNFVTRLQPLEAGNQFISHEIAPFLVATQSERKLPEITLLVTSKAS
jgi:hypothetical protein